MSEDNHPAGRAAWLAHPLFLTFVVFVLTSIIGTFINQSIQRNADARRSYDDSLVQIAARWQDDASHANRITTLMFERAAMTDLLRSALQRQVMHEVLERKILYDAIYQRWNTQLPQILATLDGFDAAEGLRAELSASFIGDFASKFARIDGCITLVHDRFLSRATQHAFASSHLSCPPEAVADPMRWLRLDVDKIRTGARRFETELLTRFEARRQIERRVAECIFDRRPSVWSRIMMSEVEQDEADILRARECQVQA